MSSKEILIKNNSDSVICVNELVLKVGESLKLSNEKPLYIYKRENMFFNEIFNVFYTFFLIVLNFMLRMKSTEQVTFIQNRDVNGLLRYYRKCMYVHPKGETILVSDVQNGGISDIEIYEDGYKLDFMFDSSKKEFEYVTRMLQKLTNTYRIILLVLMLLVIVLSLFLISYNSELSIILLITALPITILLIKGICVLNHRMITIKKIYEFFIQNNKCNLDQCVLEKIVF